MGVQSIDNNLVTQFSDKIHLLSQQKLSKLKSIVEIIPITSADDHAYDRLDGVQANEVFGRAQEVQFSDITHSRRKLPRRRFDIVIPIDQSDVRGALLDISGKYAQQFMSALNREIDRIIVEAMFADVQTGRNFENTVTAVNDGVTTVNATAGLTYEKLLEITENFMDADVGNEEMDRLYLSITGKEHSALMNETELISGDFTHQFAVERGRMRNALGMDLLAYAGSPSTTPILDVNGSTRDLFAMSNRAMALGISKDISIEVQPRFDLVDTFQIVGILQMGAVRTEGKLIQKVQTTV